MTRSALAGTASCAIAAWLVAPVMGQQVELDPASLMTTPIVLMDGNRRVSQGTGFFFASTTPDGKADTVFLVTNYHVVTGHAPLSTQPRAGDRIRFVLQLGYVWKAALIADLARNYRPKTSEVHFRTPIE